MRKSLLRLFVLMMVVLTAVSTTTPPQPITAQPLVAQGAIDSRFGAVESFWAPNEAAELGIGWERILFYWNEIQPSGSGDWNTLHVHDEWLNEATAQGRQVVGLLKNTPVWATDGEFGGGVPRGLYLPTDDPANLWANYARQVASYYGARGVHHWIIWNEPDIADGVYGHEFNGTIEDYYQLMKVAYTVIKEADPSATVLLGGMTYWHDPSYLRRYLQVVAADPEAAANNYYFDVISLHIYFRPETMSTIVGNGFAAQQQAGITPLKAVWVNETNARPNMDPEWPVDTPLFPIDLEMQAWYIPQAYALGFYAGAGRIAMYKMVDISLPPGGESWGLIRPHDKSHRPAYYSYQTTIKYLSGFTYPIKREQSGNHYLISFSRPQGVTRVMWARNPAAVTLQVPALADSALLVQSTGETTTIVPENGSYTINLEGARCYGECLMGGPPLFLVEEGVMGDTIPTAPPPPPTHTPEVTETAVISPTGTSIPVTATASPSPTAEASSTPTKTRTPKPTPSDTPIPPTETLSSTKVPATETGIAPTLPPATEVALLVVESTLIPTLEIENSVNEEPSGQASYWLLGTAVLLGISLLGITIRNRRQ